MKYCNVCGVFEDLCACEPEDPAQGDDGGSPDASRCSHGGDNAMGIAARSHDCARDQERKEFWKDMMIALAGIDCPFDSRHAITFVNDVLEEFDKRFGATADAEGETPRGHV